MKKHINLILPKFKLFIYIMITFFSLIFIIGGIVRTTSAFVLYTNGIKTDATVYQVVDTKEDRYLMLYYKVDGLSYKIKLSYAFTNYQEGNKIQIWYSKTNPSIYIEPYKTFPITILISLIGLLFFSMFIIKIIKYYKEYYRINTLLQKKNMFIGKIIDITYAGSKYKINDIEPIIVKASHNEKTYISKLLYYNNASISLIGYYINIYFDKADVDNYYLDITSARKENNNEI